MFLMQYGEDDQRELGDYLHFFNGNYYLRNGNFIYTEKGNICCTKDGVLCG